MTNDLRDLAMGFRLSKKSIDTEVEGFVNAHTEEAAKAALILGRRNMEKKLASGLNPGTPLMNWRWATNKIVQEIGQEQRREEQRAETQAAKDAYLNSKNSGYIPNRETILAQLEQLYADGKISHQEYDWGIKGLNVVHGFVAMKEDVVDPEFGF